jgi:ribosomal protein S18 acetylase RimI-like enzyme
MLHLFPGRSNVAFLAKAQFLCHDSFREEGPSDIIATGNLYCTACLVEGPVPVTPRTSVVVGCASMYASDSAVEIWNVAVAPSHRRRGHCRSLIRACVTLASLMFPDLPVRIVVHVNNPIQAAYRRLGFTTTIKTTTSSVVLQHDGTE